MRIGVAELPLHGGHVPRWMIAYMRRMARAIVSVIIEEFGPGELVARLADPFWFQALNNAIGMDWDSSGSTTVTLGVLRQVLDENPELGVIVAGGKGLLAREAPVMLEEKAEKAGIPGRVVEEARRASRIAAKTDNVLLLDGYTLYHHAVIASSDGKWAIIQQGLNPESKLARRYHWLSPLPPEPTLEPHSSIAASRREERVVDATSRASLEARRTIVDLARENPRKVLSQIAAAYAALRGVRTLTSIISREGYERARILVRYYRPQAKPPRHIENVLRRVYETSPRSIEELVLVEGVGPAVFRSLALVSELIYGYTMSHEDPANTPLDPFRYAYVIGGKDGVPFAFNPRLAEEVVAFLESALEKARIGEKDRLRALARLRQLLPRRGLYEA